MDRARSFLWLSFMCNQVGFNFEQNPLSGPPVKQYILLLYNSSFIIELVTLHIINTPILNLVYRSHTRFL